MNKPTAPHLLRSYVEQGSESAFAELVRRHVNLVYSAALRMVCDPQIAQDVTQATFVALARNAGRLLDRPLLSSWLHRTAQNIAAQTVRAEVRRRARDQEAAVMNSLLSTEQDPQWEQISPHLDAALGEMSEFDRDAVMLRYFENKSLRTIGQILGLSDDAAQKRVSRALDKLRAGLIRRGVTTSTAALAADLPANAVVVAPIGLAAIINSAALSGAGIATPAALAPKILTLVAAAKTTSILSTFTVLLLVGGGAVMFSAANSGSKSISVAHGDLTAALVADAGEPRGQDVESAPVVAAIQVPEAVAMALARLREVLYDPNRMRTVPDPDLEQVMQAFGSDSKAAIPLLREALMNRSHETRWRAAYGLGLIGPDARLAVPDLLQMLRADASGGIANAVAVALARIGPVPEALAELASIMKENPDGNFGFAIANFMPQIVGTNLQTADRAFRPLLQDSNPEKRQASAYILAQTLGSKAGHDVIQVAIPLLKSDDDRSLRVTGLTMLRNAGQDPQSQCRVTRRMIGDQTGEAIAALMEVAPSAGRNDLRAEALEMLDGLNPNFREQFPEAGAWLKDEEATQALVHRALTEQGSMAELIDGMKQYPMAAPGIASALSTQPDKVDVRSVLPALTDALNRLLPAPDATGPDRLAAYGMRQSLADSMQKIAPDRPKILFTQDDMRAVMPILRNSALRADPERWKKVHEAEQLALAGRVNSFSEATPDQIRHLLAALRNADEPTYDSVAAKVRKIDPNFISTSQK